MAMNKVAARNHQKAVELLKKDVLSFDDKCFVIENYHEAGESNNKIASAHFTPYELANDFKLDVHGNKILDLCAGIGVLAFAYLHGRHHTEEVEIVCVELNPCYVEVGKKVLPEAEWICGDIFDPAIQEQLTSRNFSTAISNPHFGNNALLEGQSAPRYKGKLFEYAVIDIASDLAEYGAFIIPQSSSPFLYSGVQYYQDARHFREDFPNGGQLASNMKKYNKLHEQTGIDLEIGAGIDTTVFKDQWRNVSISIEIVTAEFEELRSEEIKFPDMAAIAAAAPITQQLTLL